MTPPRPRLNVPLAIGGVLLAFGVAAWLGPKALERMSVNDRDAAAMRLLAIYAATLVCALGLRRVRYAGTFVLVAASVAALPLAVHLVSKAASYEKVPTVALLVATLVGLGLSVWRLAQFVGRRPDDAGAGPRLLVALAPAPLLAAGLLFVLYWYPRRHQPPDDVTSEASDRLAAMIDLAERHTGSCAALWRSADEETPRYASPARGSELATERDVLDVDVSCARDTHDDVWFPSLRDWDHPASSCEPDTWAAPAVSFLRWSRDSAYAEAPLREGEWIRADPDANHYHVVVRRKADVGWILVDGAVGRRR